jgi:hypothetical protein
MNIRPLGLTGVGRPLKGGRNHVCRVNLARPGREQPKLGRLALRGVRVRVKRPMEPGENYASSLSDPPYTCLHCFVEEILGISYLLKH